MLPSSKNPDSRGVKYRGVRKIAIFDQNCHLFRKWYEIVPWLLWNVNWKSKVASQSMLVPTTLSDRRKQNMRCQIFQAISLIMLTLFDLD